MSQPKRSGVLFALVGPAGSGKTTIASRICRDFPKDTGLSISVTSRSPREGEKDGVHYYFVSRQDFESKAKAGEFFEWEETHGNYYGTLKKTLDDSIAQARDLVLDIDIRGALNFKKNYPTNAVIVFLVAPSADALVNRIKGRGSVTVEEITRRLATAKSEYDLFHKNSSSIDYLIVNDELETTYQSVRSILLAERTRLARLETGSVRSLTVL